MAWECKVSQLELEVDSEVVVGFLRTGISESHPLSFLVRMCYGFISRDWIVRISHKYRETNRLADELANYAFFFASWFSVFLCLSGCCLFGYVGRPERNVVSASCSFVISFSLNKK